MTNSKQTKKALLSSVIALILCLSMLIGTTFAWFTDSVSSDWNEIKAGNLDIELYYGKGEPTKKVESTTKDLFTDANGEAILWEPGVVAYTNLKVANEGTLALKYQLAVNFQNENATTDGYSLSQVLKVGVVEGGVKNTDRDLVVKEVKTEDWQNLAVFQKTGSLMAKGVEGAAKTYGIVIWWEPSAEDNNWNLNNGRQTTDGKDYLHIDLGVKLIATQFTYEEDSFDKLYDQGANATDVIDGVTYLYDGTDIVLYDAADYTEEDLVIPEGVTKIGRSAFSGNTTLETVVLPSTVVEVDDYAFSQTAIENVVLNEGLKTIGDRAFQKMPNMTSIEIPSTVETIQEYAFQGSKLTTLVIPASVTRIDQAAFAYSTTLETIIIEGSPVIGDSVNASNKGVNYVARACPNLKTVMLLGDDIEFATKGITFANAESGILNNITFYAANETVKAKLIDATSELKGKEHKVIVAAPVTDGILKAADGTRYVYSAEGLQNLYTAVSANPGEGYGVTVTLMDDIDMAGKTWTPVDTMWMTLDGNGHTIFNLTCGADAHGQSGLFPYAGHVTIKNLTLHNVTAAGSQAGAFFANAEGCVMENCTLSGNVVISYEATAETYNGIGAIIGWSNATTMTGVEIAEGTVITLSKGTITTDGNFLDNYVGAGGSYTGTVTDKGAVQVAVSTSAELAAAINAAPVTGETVFVLADGTYADDITLTVAAMPQKGNMVFKAAEGAEPVLTGTVTLGYYKKGDNSSRRWEANIAFEGITFDHALAEHNSLEVSNVKSLTMRNCTVIGDGEYGISSPGSNNTGKSLIEYCDFIDAGVQVNGNFGSGLVIQYCTFDEACVNVQGGTGLTIQNCEFKNTVTDAHNNESFYAVRTNAIPITVKDSKFSVDSTVTGVGVAGEKGWGIFVNRLTADWTVTNVDITMTEAALAQPALKVAACLSTGKINMSNWTLNGGPVHEYSEEDGTLWDTIKNLKSGDVLVIPGGTHNVSGKFQVPAGVTIMGKAGETVVFHQNSTTQDDLFNCEGDVTFCNVIFESNRKGYAITYKNQDHVCDGDITVINCKFIGLAADKNYGIYKNLNGNLTVMNCTFENYNNAICGVNNQNGSTTVVTGCTFTNINGEAIGYVISSVPADFEANAIANNTGLTADNVIGY